MRSCAQTETMHFVQVRCILIKTRVITCLNAIQAGKE